MFGPYPKKGDYPTARIPILFCGSSKSYGAPFLLFPWPADEENKFQSERNSCPSFGERKSDDLLTRSGAPERKETVGTLTERRGRPLTNAPRNSEAGLVLVWASRCESVVLPCPRGPTYIHTQNWRKNEFLAKTYKEVIGVTEVFS